MDDSVTYYIMDSVSWIYLTIAIMAEVAATSALKATEGFTRLGPSAIVVAGYSIAFYCLSLCLKTIPIGVAYAIWSGLGILLIAIAGMVLYGQKVDAPAAAGFAMIIAGVVTINLFSGMAPR